MPEIVKISRISIKKGGSTGLVGNAVSCADAVTAKTKKAAIKINNFILLILMPVTV
jgi:hypothetical protein